MYNVHWSVGRIVNYGVRNYRLFKQRAHMPQVRKTQVKVFPFPISCLADGSICLYEQKLCMGERPKNAPAHKFFYEGLMDGKLWVAS